MRKILSAAAVTAVMTTSATAFAEKESTWYLNTALGYQFIDSEFQVDDTPVFVIGVEDKLNSKWGVELWGTIGNTDDELASGDVDVATLSVGVLRYYDVKNSKLTPYSALGIGHAGLGFDNRPDEEDFFSQANLGGGARYMLNNRVGVRGDARYLHGLDDSTNDFIVSIGLSVDLTGGGATTPNDADDDGVIDDNDQCPDTPAGVAVDAAGCPLDTDQDGVANYLDKCPNTAAGVQVDESGCKFALTSTESIKLEINFAVDSAVVPAAYRGELEKVAAFMKKFGNVRAVIEGHTDDSGEAAYNDQLSQRRADGVRKVLVEDYGIAANRLSAVGYGEGRPIANNETVEGRKANRRVVAVIEAAVSK